MATTYTRPGPEADVYGFLGKAIRKWHPELLSAEVTVGILAAWPSESGEQALKLHGYPCAAIVKITPYKQRVQGIEDAVITIDGPTWKDLGDDEKLALIDHELVHLEVARDEDGQVKSDDCGRPKLKTRLHDWQLGGFKVIAERHGAAALESQVFREAHRTYYQAVFSWADDQAPQDEAPELDLAGVKEAESGPAGWRYVTVGEIGLEEKTVELLDEDTISTVGELVVIIRNGAPWLGAAAIRDIGNALERFRGGLTTEQLADFDAVRRGESGAGGDGMEAEAEEPKAARPKRGRKASA